MNKGGIDGSDFLLETLSSLAKEFDKIKVPLILGGGLSMYIKIRFMKKKRSPRYQLLPFQRSTKDIDIFLTSDIIVNPVVIENIKSVISYLGFNVKTAYFQFIKEIDFEGSKKEVILDLLSQPVTLRELEKVKVSETRIRPKDVDEFHAFHHKEAAIINTNLIKVEDFVDRSLTNLFQNVFLLSSFSFIVLKLHAFRDRINDDKKDFGRYHAYDIFSAIIEMDDIDWKASQSQYTSYESNHVIIESKKIIREYFSNMDSLGIIRLKENQLYARDREEYDKYINSFIEDLNELIK